MASADPPPEARKRVTGAERRARILAAADRLFGANDYARVSIGAIAEAAGVSPPVVYDHFASKQELYGELLATQAERLVAATTLVEPAATLAHAVHANVEAFFAFVEEHPGAWRMLFRDAPSDPEIGAVHRQIQAAATARLAETVVARAGHLALSTEVPDEQASLMLAELGKSALNGLAAWWWVHPEVSRATVVAVAYDLLWNGIAGLSGDG